MSILEMELIFLFVMNW